MKTVLGGPTQLNPSQIRLRQLFSVERILSARGFEVKKEGTARETILEKAHWTRQDLEQMFAVFENPQSKSDRKRVPRTVLT